MSFETVTKFENIVAKFFGSKYAVATDSCTHAIELCLIYKKFNNVSFPRYTYPAIPMTGIKLKLNWTWQKKNNWKGYYFIENTNIIDAAVYWKKKSYIKGTFMCLSFQFQKHINIGRGGMILTDDAKARDQLIKMAHDGRKRNIEWRKQNISLMGYHYYMTPETAAEGINIFKLKKNLTPRSWSYKDYPDLKKMKIFK